MTLPKRDIQHLLPALKSEANYATSTCRTVNKQVPASPKPELPLPFQECCIHRAPLLYGGFHRQTCLEFKNIIRQVGCRRGLLVLRESNGAVQVLPGTDVVYKVEANYDTVCIRALESDMVGTSLLSR